MKPIIIDPKFLNFIRPSEHSTFSPSSIEMIVACPYSVKANRGLPDIPNKWAEAGTAAHTVCEDYANHHFFDAPKTKELLNATEAQMHAAEGWVEVLQAWLDDENKIGDVLFFSLETGIPVYPEESAFGTTDAVIIGTKGCVILDFKNGSKRVSAQSTQLLMYLLGVHLHLKNIPANYGWHAVIYQPNCQDVPIEHEYAVDDLLTFAEMLKYTIAATKKPGLTPQIGPSHCHWCKARTTTIPGRMCPAQANKAIDVDLEPFAEYLHDATIPVKTLAPADRNPKRDAAIKRLMAIKPLIDSVVKQGMAEFQHRLEINKETIPGIMLVNKLGNRQWALDENALAITLKKRYGISAVELVPAKERLKSPAVVEKEVGKAKFDNGLTMKKATATVALDDRDINKILGELANYGTLDSDDADGDIV